jgi:hypothetical protein
MEEKEVKMYLDNRVGWFESFKEYQFNYWVDCINDSFKKIKND